MSGTFLRIMLVACALTGCARPAAAVRPVPYSDRLPPITAADLVDGDDSRVLHGRRIQFSGKVEIDRSVSLVTIGADGPTFSHAHLFGMQGGDLSEGESVVVDGIIVDEGYGALFVYVSRFWSGDIPSWHREPDPGVVERLPATFLRVSWPIDATPTGREAVAEVARRSRMRIHIVERPSQAPVWDRALNLPHAVGDLRAALDLLITDVNSSSDRRFVWHATAEREITIFEEDDQP